MTDLIDTTEFLLMQLILILLLTSLNIVFFIFQKRDQITSKLKIIIIILFGITIPLFILSSISYLNLTSKSLRSSKKVVLGNINLFLLCASIGIFFYSLYDSDNDIVMLKPPSFFKSRKGLINIGKVTKGSQKKHKFFLSLEDLEKHMFICGATGTGKTNFLQHFLINLSKYYSIPFLLVEFKGEYHFLQRKIDNLLIIRPGENFSINIFNPEGSNPEVHAERVFDILKSGKFLDDSAEFSPQMEKVLVEILTKVCKNEKLQSWKGFYENFKSYAKENQKDIPMLNQTLISITNRIRRFSLGSLKAIFDTEHKIKVEDLFNKNILIDLSSIIRLGGEKEDALFFLNMVLKYLWDKNLTRGAYDFSGIKHITIVEDSQYFAPKDLIKKSKLTSYLEDIALLQRGTGECLISLATHSDISEEILANVGVLVCFKTHMQKEFLCTLLNLDTENEDFLSILDQGQCIVRVNSVKRPFLLSVPLIKREWLEFSEISQKNNQILELNENLSMNKNIDISNKNTSFIKNFKEDIIKNLKKLGEKMKNIKDLFKKRKNVEKKFDGLLDNNIINEEELQIEDEVVDHSFNELKQYIQKLYNEQQKKS